MARCPRTINDLHDSLRKGVEDTGYFFIWEQTSKSQAGMIIDCDVQRLDAGAWVAMGAIAGGADSRVGEAA